MPCVVCFNELELNSDSDLMTDVYQNANFLFLKVFLTYCTHCSSLGYTESIMVTTELHLI